MVTALASVQDRRCVYPHGPSHRRFIGNSDEVPLPSPVRMPTSDIPLPRMMMSLAGRAGGFSAKNWPPNNCESYGLVGSNRSAAEFMR